MLVDATPVEAAKKDIWLSGYVLPNCFIIRSSVESFDYFCLHATTVSTNSPSLTNFSIAVRSFSYSSELSGAKNPEDVPYPH